MISVFCSFAQCPHPGSDRAFLEHLPFDQQQLGCPARMSPHHPPQPVARPAPSHHGNTRLIQQGETPVSQSLMRPNFCIYSNQLPPFSPFSGSHNTWPEGGHWGGLFNRSTYGAIGKLLISGQCDKS